jgi:serine/threonine protein kinase
VNDAQDEERIFLSALEISSAPRRASYVAEACANDSKLHRRVQALLARHDESTGVLDAPPPGIDGDSVGEDAQEKPGAVIGPFTLLEQIGEGGFGVVFLAEQRQPVKRRVALKVIKPGMDTRACLGRFEAERQALALMDHANIAKVLEAGTTEYGRPFFVMELVQGVPITEYCDQCQLTTRERLELFMLVCQAVQHAHQKGVIHRDIKPSNVLVTIQDGQAVPKIIDFGIAKAIDNQRLTEQTLVTAFRDFIGTPMYMSPEQAELSPLGVDTRTDIYSLGVLLYELLTGTTPIEKERLQSASFDELRRIIREEEPPRPSTRISTLAADSATTLADCHRADPRRLLQAVRGELDWIVMKCLEKDRNRRYESASTLAQEVRRYLDDEPVLACPPSAAYRVSKFARRHKIAFRALGAVALALILGTAVSTWQAIIATREKGYAQQARANAENNLRVALEAINNSFMRVSESVLLHEPAMAELRRRLLEDALVQHENLVSTSSQNPALQAELAATHYRIAVIRHDLLEDWVPAFEQFVQIMKRLVPRHPDVDDFGSLRGGIYRISVSNVAHIPDPERAVRTVEEAIDLWTHLVKEHPAVPGFRNDLALFHYLCSYIYEGLDRDEDSERSARAACDLWRRLMHEYAGETLYRANLASALSHHSTSLAVLERFDEAREASDEALQTASQLPPGVAIWRQLSVTLYEHRGGVHELAEQLSEAVDAWREMARRQEDLMRDYKTSADHFGYRLQRCRQWMGEVLWALDRKEEAQTEFVQIRDLPDKLSLKDPYNIELRAWFFANCADPDFRDPSLAVELIAPIAATSEWAGDVLTLGAVQYRAGKRQLAIETLRRAAKMNGRYNSAYARLFLAMAHWDLGNAADAEKWYQEAIAIEDGWNWSPTEFVRLREETEKLMGKTETEPSATEIDTPPTDGGEVQ